MPLRRQIGERGAVGRRRVREAVGEARTDREVFTTRASLPWGFAGFCGVLERREDGSRRESKGAEIYDGGDAEDNGALRRSRIGVSVRRCCTAAGSVE